MANWFKVYETDLDDSKFQLLVDENPTVIPVWFWILTECAKFKDGVIEFKFEPRYFRMIGKKINQDSACISEALNALHKDGFIILGENSIELMGWESRQSEFMRKQKGKEIKKVKESLNLSPDKDLTMSEVRPDNVPIRGERGEEKEEKEENIIIPVFSENCTDLSANADASSNFEVNTISSFSNSENLNQELTLLKSQNSNLKQKESGRFSGELIEIKQVKPDYPDLFERLWTGYRAVAKDKAGGKQEAFKAWQKVKNKANPQDFEKAIAAYSLSKRVKEGFILNFSTFLNSGRWETELENGSESMEEEKRRANGRALKAQAEAQLEEEYRTGARWRP
jgi:hypothetical protein